MNQFQVILRPDNSDIDEQYVGSGPTLLAALGDLDRQVFAMSGESLLDDDNLEAEEMLATLIAGAPYKRIEMGGDNFTMWKEVGRRAANEVALPAGNREAAEAKAIVAVAEAMHDSLVQLGIDPDERPEHGGERTVDALARMALRGARSVGAFPYEIVGANGAPVDDAVFAAREELARTLKADDAGSETVRDAAMSLVRALGGNWIVSANDAALPRPPTKSAGTSSARA